MEKVLADAFLDFYKKMLKPEFDAIKAKQAEHDERFAEMMGHFDSVYNRLEKAEAEVATLKSRIRSIEGLLDIADKP